MRNLLNSLIFYITLGSILHGEIDTYWNFDTFPSNWQKRTGNSEPYITHFDNFKVTLPEPGYLFIKLKSSLPLNKINASLREESLALNRQESVNEILLVYLSNEENEIVFSLITSSDETQIPGIVDIDFTFRSTFDVNAVVNDTLEYEFDLLENSHVFEVAEGVGVSDGNALKTAGFSNHSKIGTIQGPARISFSVKRTPGCDESTIGLSVFSSVDFLLPGPSGPTSQGEIETNLDPLMSRIGENWTPIEFYVPKGDHNLKLRFGFYEFAPKPEYLFDEFSVEPIPEAEVSATNFVASEFEKIVLPEGAYFEYNSQIIGYSRSVVDSFNVNLTWLKDGIGIREFSQFDKTRIGFTVTPDDTGLYQLEIFDNETRQSDIVDMFELTVTEAYPQIVLSSDNINSIIYPESPTTIEAFVEFNDPSGLSLDSNQLQFQWFKDETLLRGQSTPQLFLENPSEEDQGGYTLLVTDPESNIKESISGNLFFLEEMDYRSDVMLFKKSDITLIKEGQSKTLSGVALSQDSQRQPIDGCYYWTFNGEPIQGSGGELLIKDANNQDEGFYELSFFGEGYYASTRFDIQVDSFADIFPSAIRLDEDWQYIPWIGFAEISNKPWIYFREYGFLYLDLPSQSESIAPPGYWVFHTKHQWMYFSEETMPYIYSTLTEDWGYLYSKNGIKWKYCYQKQEWEKFEL